MALPEGLLEAVCNYLDITWVDEATDQKLSGIIERGMKYINRAVGADMDYSTEDKARQLLLDYCFYVQSKALNEFSDDKHYGPELLSLQQEQEVKRYIEEHPDL